MQKLSISNGKAADIMPKGLETVVTVGNFDGVHRGHARLIARTTEIARKLGAASVAVTFEPHTRSVVMPELSTKLLTTAYEKSALLEDLGLDYVVSMDFDEKFRQMEQAEFIEAVLIRNIRAVGWVMGEGHHVGRHTDRNLAGVKKNSHFAVGKYHINTFMESLESADGAVISSTRIRGLISDGRVFEAKAMLGRPYLIAAERVSGVKVATKLGYPTLNFKCPDARKVAPPVGVYAAEMEFYGGSGKCVKYIGALYFGDCPTYSDREMHFEFHALKYNDAYREPAIGETVHLWLHKYIRPDVAFRDEGALKAQITEDINEIKKNFSEEMQ